MSEILLQLHRIQHRHGNKSVLKNADLQIARGEIVALIGENGAGKSTLLSIAANLQKPQAGQRQYTQPMPRIVWLGDKPALYPDWTVETFIHCSADCQAVADAKAAALAAVAACGLESVLTTPCKHLSHGFRQRVALAGALAARPDLLCLDEPGNGLDMGQKLALRTILRQVAQSAGVLLVHHDLEEVVALADRVYALQQGYCLALPLPAKEECWLWCEWETAEQAQSCLDAQQRLGSCSGYLFTDTQARAEKMQQLSRQTGLLRMGFHYPAAALQAQREALLVPEALETEQGRAS